MSKKSNSKLLVLGAGALAAYYLWKKDKSSTTTNAVDTGTETATDANLNNFVPVDTAAATSFTSQDISSDKKKVTRAENKTATDTAEEKDKRNSAYYFGDKSKPYDSFYDYTNDPSIIFDPTKDTASINSVRVRISKLRFFYTNTGNTIIPYFRNKKVISPYIILEFINPNTTTVHINEIILESLKINNVFFNAEAFADYFNKIYKDADFQKKRIISDMWLTKKLNNNVEDNYYKSLNSFLKGTTNFSITLPPKSIQNMVYMGGPFQGSGTFVMNPKNSKTLAFYFPFGFYLESGLSGLNALQKISFKKPNTDFLPYEIKNLELKINIGSVENQNYSPFMPSPRTITVNNVESKSANAVNDNFNITEYLKASDFEPIIDVGNVYTLTRDINTLAQITNKYGALLND